MSVFFRSNCLLFGAAALLVSALSAPSADAAPKQSSAALRASFIALMDTYQQVYQQEGDLRGMLMVDQAKAALSRVDDEALARILARATLPDFAPATSAMERLRKSSQRAMVKSALITAAGTSFPSSPSVIDACVNTPHGDQITYDALIAYQVTSGILAAANYVCNETVLGENGAAACIPFAIANDIASSLFSVRNFCSGLDSSAAITGIYDRTLAIDNDLAAARTDILNNANTNTTAINANVTAAVSASTASINANSNANTTALTTLIGASTTSINNNTNSNTAALITNSNANRDQVIAQLQALNCEIVRLLNTADGKRSSSIAACSAQPGFPYHWPGK
jgi:hypothetical protein